MHLLVEGYEPDLGAGWYPPTRLAVLVLLFFFPAFPGPVQRAQDTVAESFQEPLIERLLRDIDQEQVAHSHGLPGPIFLGHDKLDGAPRELGSLVTVDAHPLRAGGAKVLGRRVVGVAAQVAHEFVAARAEHHERVDVRSATVTARRADVPKV